MNWSIEYYSDEVEKRILSLPSGLLARYLRLTDLMFEFGSNLGMPHTRFLGEGLIELRIKSKEGIARVFYCTLIGKKIVMLHLFIKKSNKTPKKEIQIAKNRIKEVLGK
ncbi:MAG: type II toxin-antitoxin system RelE/ParE family toxin [Bacteroidetes bacterium]|nr:type II toxin-antitoxin system RelE/ParE family toxin [Bacteroidota bacterium]MBU2585458.1 type II toxin-antitoxin system RelE/ParE family toxin [Bacteroidota bacterium]